MCVKSCLFCFRQKTACEMRISDWSSDVCSSDLREIAARGRIDVNVNLRSSRAMSKYTHVIFDFGGVVTASPFEAFNRLEEERGLPRDLVRRINAADPDGNAWAKFERAEIDAAAFDRLFAAEEIGRAHV